MEKHRILIAFIICLIGFSFLGPSVSSGETDADRTLSPYFLVKSDDPNLDRLPLKSTSATVNISGVIAHVTVQQTYKNEGSSPLEAIYTFPASTRAAVHGMKMSIGERTIVAMIEKRDEARKAYEKAKSEGRSASLLEQQRPNVFQMNVANILPGDVIQVELIYTELLVPTDKTYTFVYPTVVGPRYSGKPGTPSSTGESWVSNPYLPQSEAPPYHFHMEIDLSAGLPIADIACISHKTTVAFRGPDRAVIKLNELEKFGGNRDFILQYRLAGNKIETGLMLYEGDEENFFLLMLQPPEKVRTNQIPPREYLFIVDVSGSMHGFPLDISKTLVKDLINNLRPIDRFNILFFAGGSRIMSENSMPATPENLAHAISLMDNQQGGGGTELLPALKRALSLTKTDGTSRTILIVTDGYVSVEEEAFNTIRNNLGEANIFAFGIGTSVNRHLIEGMARVGMGEPFVITNPGEANKKAKDFRKLITTPVLTDISISFDGFDAYDLEPPGIPDVFGGRPVILSGKWKGPLEGVIQIKGKHGEGRFLQKLHISRFEPQTEANSLRYLWARSRVALLSNYNRLGKSDKRIQEVTWLGLTYNLLTAYTSFVAIDSEIRLKDGKASTVKQPLPLPHGVSDAAVGGHKRFKCKAAPSVLKSMAMLPEAAVDQLAGEEKDNTSNRNEIEIIDIRITTGISKKNAWKTLKDQLRKLNKCFQEGTVQNSGNTGKIIYTLTVDSHGTVIELKKIMGPNFSESLDNCICDHLKAASFQARPGTSAIITVVFTVK